MEDDKSTTPADNQELETPDPAGTDQQTPAPSEDNLDATSKSTESSDDADKTTTPEGKEETPASQYDTDLDEWAERTGRAKPTTDRERELYQEIRDGQREYSRKKQAKDSVESAITNANPVDNKADDYEEEDPAMQIAMEERSLRLRGEYFTEKSVTVDESRVMGEILQEKVDRAASPEAKKQAFDYWTNPSNLEDWHALAKARLASTVDPSVIAEEAARKERARIAKESQASGGTRNATTTVPTKTGYSRTEFLKSDD